MDAQALAAIAAIITAIGASWGAIKGIGAAYAAAVDRKAKEMESVRIIAQADATIAALKAENAAKVTLIATLQEQLGMCSEQVDNHREENERLWQLLRQHGIIP